MMDSASQTTISVMKAVGGWCEHQLNWLKAGQQP
jgi:hypothetical protein